MKEYTFMQLSSNIKVYCLEYHKQLNLRLILREVLYKIIQFVCGKTKKKYIRYKFVSQGILCSLF